jgi:hypothetical protein
MPPNGARGRVGGVEVVQGDGTRERIGCEALILACNGYGGNPELVHRFIPEAADATMFPNLFAAGGAAAAVSGTTAAGYLSGNGLLTATVLGRFAGEAAAALVSD